ncbi:MULTISPECIES: AraC family transcriptional regulator [unclassified Arthrobacter]|uniref:AraC family transcriptional regulator n=1 Tax=unclassified Arthrobacter TaxID=235627 RepID=UPI002882F234|nr:MULTISPECIES: AraC family transcriptional regulator [unclassified Arthrobacter]
MDPLSQFLTGPRAQAAFALRVVMDPPFAIDVQDQAALTVIVVVSGEAWISADGAEPQLILQGQAATVRGPEPYIVADAPGREATVVIDADQSCHTPSGEKLELTFSRGVLTWGNSAVGETVLLIGTYQSPAAVGQLVTSALPRLAVFGEEDLDGGLLGMLERELTHQRPGQESALDRLLDLLLLNLVRACVDRGDALQGTWANASREPVVAQALELLHQEPAVPWTVAGLALRCHVSRATMAARFRAAVGQSPMAYLSAWRLALAADSLASSNATTAIIAEEVGYSNAFTFSAAFSREYGVSPSGYRRSAQAASSRMEGAGKSSTGDRRR